MVYKSIKYISDAKIKKRKTKQTKKIENKIKKKRKITQMK